MALLFQLLSYGIKHKRKEGFRFHNKAL